MQDGLYLFGQWVAEVEAPLTKQANDLSNPTQLQTTYANLFTLPDTTAIRSLLQNAEQLDAGGRDPYRLIPARLISAGEVIFSGNATLLSFQNGWKVSLSGAMKGLFDQLTDLKLADLDLSAYNHPWTVEVIQSFATATSGITYPCIDYGSLDKGIFAQDTLLPAIFAHSVVSVMLRTVGYRPVGAWLTDALYTRIILPFVEDEPKAHDADWQSARTARVTLSTPALIPPFGNYDQLLYFDRDNDPLAGWVDGKQDNFRASQSRYVCDVPMRLNVQAYVEFNIKIDFGAVEFFLIVEKNGQNVAELREAHGGPYNQTQARNEHLTLDEYVDCLAGDQLQIRFTLRKQTTFAQYLVLGLLNETTCWAAFEPDINIKRGDDWLVAQNMPDITCTDLLKSVALMMSATYEVDELARTVTLRPLDAVVADIAHATDLSHSITEGTEPENAVIIQPYGQKNRLKWKQQQDKTLLGYGDGIIPCDAKNIPLETTLFELPWAAVIDSQTNIGGYGNPVFIETRVISGTGASIQVQPKAAPPCLLLVEPTKPVTVIVNVIQPDLTTLPTPVPLAGCWWHHRPSGVVTDENAFSLAFDAPPVPVGRFGIEQTMIQRYFKALRRILRRPRQLSVSAYLTPAEFATLDLYAPVRLRAVRAGALDLNDTYYYLSRVENYLPAQPCTLILIPF